MGSTVRGRDGGPRGAGSARLLDYLLVLPCAHVRFGDFLWQHAVYDLFHRTWPARLTHAVGMAPNTFTWVAFASLVPVGPVDAGLLVAALLAALYFYDDRLVGLVLLPALAGMWGLAGALNAAWGEAALARYAAIAAGCATLQALGHALEPVPPPWSGTTGFVPLRAWLRTASPRRLAGYAAMAGVGVGLEYWASPRLLPAQVMFVLGWLGYRPGFRAASRRRARFFATDVRYAVANRAPPGRPPLEERVAAGHR